MKTWIMVAAMVVGSLGAAADDKPADYVYRGRKVNQQWFDQAFSEFAPALGVVDDKVVDIGKAVLDRGLIPENPPAKGTIVTAAGRVANVIGDTASLVDAETPTPGRSVLVRVQGLEPGKYTDDAHVHVRVIYTGIYKFPTTGGGERTVQDYRVIAPPTREQFAQALKDGLVLVRYKAVPGGKVTEQKIP